MTMKVIFVNSTSQWPDFKNRQIYATFVYLRNTYAMQATQDSLQNQIIQGIPNALLCSQITCIPYRAHPLAGVKFTLVMERNTWQRLMHGRDPQREMWITTLEDGVQDNVAHLNTDKLVAFITMYFNIQLWIWMQRTSDLTDNFSGNCTHFFRHS